MSDRNGSPRRSRREAGPVSGSSLIPALGQLSKVVVITTSLAAVVGALVLLVIVLV